MNHRRRVSVQIGSTPRNTAKDALPRMVLLGVGSFGDPWLVDTFPDTRVNDSRYAPHRLGVEHHRFVPGQPTASVQGLDGRHPSLLRDSLNLALTTCASVDLLIAHVEDARPWDLSNPKVVELLHQALAELPGLVVCMPDLSAPSLTPAQDGLHYDGLIRAVASYGPVFAEHFQLGVVDLPIGPPHCMADVLHEIRHHDIAAVSWTGTESLIRQHGWRSGAALVAGRIADLDEPMTSIVGPVPLSGGRAVRQSRRPWLGENEPIQTLPDFIQGSALELELSPGRAQIRSEGTLRSPIGMWDIPLVRTAKIIHYRIAMTANIFVFQQADEATALLLQAALLLALEDFVRRGVVGGIGTSDPEVHCVPNRDPAQPALIATVQAFLKPWVRELRLNLTVRPDHAVVLEVA